MKGFARSLAMKKRHKTIRKWPTDHSSSSHHWTTAEIFIGASIQRYIVFPCSLCISVKAAECSTNFSAGG